jgi:hypothetical protein
MARTKKTTMVHRAGIVTEVGNILLVLGRDAVGRVAE